MSPRTHEVPDELLSSLLVNYTKPEDLIGENGLLKQLTKRLVERALDAEMTEHLGHDKHEPVANAAGNTRNGRSRKTLKCLFHRRITQRIPLLQQMNPQHRRQCVRLPTWPPRRRIVQRDQPEQLLPRNDLLHLGQKYLAPGLLTLAQALSVTERQLHG
ncbi:Xax1 transposase [Xanthomonas citri pv. fuscans]|nr:Xax1 transposase [Xanthomonas citri pv. fuscans]